MKGPSQADLLVQLAGDVDLFVAPDGKAYATAGVEHHRETWAVRSVAFRSRLASRFYTMHEKAPGGQAMTDALGAIEGRARFGGPTRPVFVRVAAVDDAIYIDLGDPAWQVVEVTAAGWRVLTDSPVRFRRPFGIGRLPYPVRGGRLEELREYLNVGDGDDGDARLRLLVAWLLGALHPTGPYVTLVLYGEQGSAKSATARLLRSLVDPAVTPLRSAPREERDLAIAAASAWVVSYDNLSGLRDWQADAICRLATGGGIATRRLYTDDEEEVFDLRRPVILNGIDDLATRSDLLDRAIVVELPRIPEEARREEAQLWETFAGAHARLLGALLDAVAAAMRNRSAVQLDRLPRMADFARWVVAAERDLGWPDGSFLKAYMGNRQAAHELGLDASPLVIPLRSLLDEIEPWEGTAAGLLDALEVRAGERTDRRGWPRDARGVASDLRRLAPDLRAVGIEVTFVRVRGARIIRIGEEARRCVTTDTPSTDAPESASPVRHPGPSMRHPASPLRHPDPLPMSTEGDGGVEGDAPVPPSANPACPTCGKRMVGGLGGRYVCTNAPGHRLKGVA
ncbi:MAG: hypothetical protein M0Z49_16195 [Chloroflexi bacterium]|nr:hypothetical protein [Chloroflexota bacterium]